MKTVPGQNQLCCVKVIFWNNKSVMFFLYHYWWKAFEMCCVVSQRWTAEPLALFLSRLWCGEETAPSAPEWFINALKDFIMLEMKIYQFVIQRESGVSLIFSVKVFYLLHFYVLQCGPIKLKGYFTCSIQILFLWNVFFIYIICIAMIFIYIFKCGARRKSTGFWITVFQDSLLECISSWIICVHMYSLCVCVYLEVDCGWPSSLRHSVVMWNNSSSLGSVALYVCEAGYRRVGEGNVSVCNSNAKWSKIDMRCEGTYSMNETFHLLWYAHQKPLLSLFRPTCPYIVPDLYDFYSSMKHKRSLF